MSALSIPKFPNASEGMSSPAFTVPGFRHRNRLHTQLTRSKRKIGSRDRENILRAADQFRGNPSQMHDALHGRFTVEELGEVLFTWLDTYRRLHTLILSGAKSIVQGNYELSRQIAEEQKEGW